MNHHITVLGTGRMGFALAAAFLAKDCKVTVWNRTPAKAKPLAQLGATVASSVEEAVAKADIVVGNVSDYPTSEALLAPPAVLGALRGKLFLQLATGSPRQAKAGAAWAREHQVRYLDGAIMATPNFIGQPGCTILYSGAVDLFREHEAVLRVLGGNAIHVGAEIGHANALDAAILTVLWGSLFGTWHAAAICEAEGFPLPAFASTLAATMPVLEGSMKDSIERIAERRFAADETTMASLDVCHASVRLIHEISEQHRIHLGLPDALEAIFRRASESGRGADDLATAYQGMVP